ncbi:hypothetical protein FPV67DRAFT_1457948 [Lyophyllum atratum]|nr:hypothetical protein FPV67DRAFT_1457948 [Lyophyllum atratum]
MTVRLAAKSVSHSSSLNATGYGCTERTWPYVPQYRSRWGVCGGYSGRDVGTPISRGGTFECLQIVMELGIRGNSGDPGSLRLKSDTPNPLYVALLSRTLRERETIS